MYENENVVTEEVTEKVETTPTEEKVEETPKMYTEEEMNARLHEVLGKRLARQNTKIRKEYERKYSELENVLKAGTGKETVEEITETFKDFYSQKGVDFSKGTSYSPKDIEMLAKAEADEIINSGYDDVVEEVDRLASVGVANMTAREKATFKILANHRAAAEKKKELLEIGVSEDEINGNDFKEFASKFNDKTPIAEVYKIYASTKPQKEFKTMGSMKNTLSDEGTIKDFYTMDEAKRFTKEDFDKNPALFKAVEASMHKW